MIYLDYAANYPTKKEVLDSLISLEENYIGNYNSSHPLGIKSKNKFIEIDNSIHRILNLSSEHEIVYTSSATEANNLAIKGIAESYSGFGKKILVSELEHSSSNGTLGYLKDKGFDVQFIKTDETGSIDFNDLNNKLSKDVILVIVGLIDGETGFVQDYKRIKESLNSYPNTFLLVDATQAIGKYKIDFSFIDLLVFAPHKFGGLTGTGCLVKKKRIVLTPLFHGGESNSIYRSGSVPLGLIGTIEKSLSLAYRDLDSNYIKVDEINKYLINELSKINGIMINSFNNPYIVNISYLNYLAKDVVDFLGSRDICVSQKSACSIKNTPSKIIMSIYKDKKRATSSFRISLCELVTKDEIDKLIIALKEVPQYVKK